jgi:hypothetical protein
VFNKGDNLMLCSKCNTDNEIGSPYCMGCGSESNNKQSKQSQGISLNSTETVQVFQCPNCNKKNEDNARYCDNCGQLFENKQLTNKQHLRQYADPVINRNPVWTPIAITCILFWVMMLVLTVYLEFRPIYRMNLFGETHTYNMFSTLIVLGDAIGIQTFAEKLISSPLLYVSVLFVGTLFCLLTKKVNYMLFPLLFYSMHYLTTFFYIIYNRLNCPTINPFGPFQSISEFLLAEIDFHWNKYFYMLLAIGATLFFLSCKKGQKDIKTATTSYLTVVIIIYPLSIILHALYFYNKLGLSSHIDITPFLIDWLFNLEYLLEELRNMLFFGGVAMLCFGYGSKQQEKVEIIKP